MLHLTHLLCGASILPFGDITAKRESVRESCKQPSVRQ